jgi:hypothetical protein
MEEIIEVPAVEYGDMYLKFTDEAQATAALYSSFEVEVPVAKIEDVTVYLVQGEPDEDGDREDYRTEQPPEGAVILDSWTEQSHVFSHNEVQTELRPKYPTLAIDVIGVIYKPTGVMLEEDTPEMAPLSGWHVNTRGEMPEALQQYAVIPTNPRRVWA